MEHTDFLSPTEQQLFDRAKAEEKHIPLEEHVSRMPTAAGQTTAEESTEQIKDRYQKNGVRLYAITASLAEDDDTNIDIMFLFKRPSVSSYDRYIKTVSTSMSKASRAFVLDNIVEEQKEMLKETLEDYPAFAISVTGKLLAMLGMADSVAVKKA